MKRTGRTLAVIALTTLYVLVALPALGQEDDEEGTTETTAVAENLVPAVPVESPEEAAALEDWTYRYMVPTGLALAAIVILFTSIRYFTNVVRKRYRTVQE